MSRVTNLSKLRQERMREINLRVSWHVLEFCINNKDYSIGGKCWTYFDDRQESTFTKSCDC